MTDIIVEDKKGKDIKYLPQFKLFHKFLNAYQVFVNYVSISRVI